MGITNKERIVGSADIVDVIGSAIDLKKKGKNWSACCPFHAEKTPSFSVNQDKQFYYCFGCGAGGDVVKFIMDFDKVDFIGAIKKLSRITGIPMEEGGNESRPIVSRMKMKKLIDAELTEKMIIAMHNEMVFNGEEINEEDKKRAALAEQRVKEIQKMKMNY